MFSLTNKALKEELEANKARAEAAESQISEMTGAHADGISFKQNVIPESFKASSALVNKYMEDNKIGYTLVDSSAHGTIKGDTMDVYLDEEERNNLNKAAVEYANSVRSSVLKAVLKSK